MLYRDRVLFICYCSNGNKKKWGGEAMVTVSFLFYLHCRARILFLYNIFTLWEFPETLLFRHRARASSWLGLVVPLTTQKKKSAI